MRYDSEHKQKTRARVLQVAARAIRADGPERVGVAGVMAEAGLTHGGFYAHFKSKDELIAAAIGTMFDESRARVLRETEGRSPAAGLLAYIEFYLSAKHRDARGGGCPIAALASDLPRQAESSREEFAGGVRRLVETLADKLESLGHVDTKEEASSMVAELVGALSLARVEPDRRHSDAILAASRAQLIRRLRLEGKA